MMEKRQDRHVTIQADKEQTKYTGEIQSEI